MRRVIVLDRLDGFKLELAENDVFELKRTEQVNGEHSLAVTTTQVLEQGDRILMEDDRGRWREWAVYGVDEAHQSGNRPFGSYYCTWSLQHDLMGTRVSAMPGVQAPVQAAVALGAALGGTSRWAVGTVTNTSLGGASMYDTDGWSAMSALVANWGGEIDAYIDMDSFPASIGRRVDYHAQQGEQEAKRRFDFGADLQSVRRTLPDGPLYCRVTPRGKGEESGEGYGRKITIASVNGGLDYLTYAPMVDLAKLPDGNGGWEYPTLEIENSDIGDPAELKAWAQSVLEDSTVPKVTYTVDVVQLAMEGVSVHGVGLGDAVQVVDGKLHGLRVSARVLAMTVDELAHTPTTLTIGHVKAGLTDMFTSLSAGIEDVRASVNSLGQSLSTADYIESLLDRINAEINATGGYTYIVPGHGVLTYDVAVADPLDPVEASQVVEIKGGTIRIANTKTAQGEWEWKTVFVSGHILAELVTAANLVSGTIGNASGDFFIDMDNRVFRLPAMTVLDGDGTTAEDLITQEISSTNLIRNGDFSDGTSYWNQVSASSGDSYSVASDSTFGNCLKWVQSDAGSSTHRILANATTNFSHVAGKTYSLSFYAKASAANTLRASVAGYTADVDTYCHEAVTTSWKRYTGTITPDTTGSLSFMLDSAGTLYLAGVCLVEADKPIPWALDPRDAVEWSTMVRTYGAGVLVCRQGNTVGALVNSNGSFDVVKVTWSGTTPTASTVYASYGDTITIGDPSKAHIEVSGTFGFGVYGKNPAATGQIIEIGRVGYESDTKPYFTFGTRLSGSTNGTSSVAMGWNATASGDYTLSQGIGTTASSSDSAAFGYYTTASNTAAAAFGSNTKAAGAYSIAMGNGSQTNGQNSFAGGVNSVASGHASFAFGGGVKTGNYYETALGAYNVVSTGNYTNALVVGGGSSDSDRKNILTLTGTGRLTIAGTLVQNSDRRLKTHVAYLGDDANVIIDRLKPAVFVKDGGRHYGFYAQDVQRADIWDTKTVEAQHTDESLDFDPLTLDYSALIAPLVAYSQNLEKRIEELERRLGDGS